MAMQDDWYSNGISQAMASLLGSQIAQQQSFYPYTYGLGAITTTTGTTFNNLGIGGIAPAPKPVTNEMWLNKRIDELRVKL